MQPLCRSHRWTVVRSLLHTKLGSNHVCFLRQCCTHSLCPTLWPLCSKTGSVLAMQPLCRSHGWTVVNHYCTQNWGLTMCFLRQCCTHCLCPTLWPLCSKTGSVLAMQPLCRSHDWTVVTSLLHTKLGSNHVFFAAMLHSQFVPHIVVMPPKLAPSWPCSLCAEVMIHCIIIAHKTGVSPCVFCGNAALTVCAPHCGPTLCHNAQTGSVLAMQPLCRSHDWTVVNHYCTQNWGLTMCFLRQCCTHSLCPSLWHCLQNWLGLGHAAFVQKS